MRDSELTFGKRLVYINDQPQPCFYNREVKEQDVFVLRKGRSHIRTTKEHGTLNDKLTNNFYAPKPYFAFKIAHEIEVYGVYSSSSWRYSFECDKAMTRTTYVVKVLEPPVPSGSSYRTYTDGDGDLVVLPVVSQSTINGARASAIAKIESTVENVNLGITVAERKETLNFIRDRSISAWKALIALKKGQVRKALQILGVRKRSLNEAYADASDAYLAFKFGFEPLMNDIQKSASSFVETLARPDHLKIKAAVASPVVGVNRTAGVANSSDFLEGCEIGYDLTIKNQELAAFQAMGILNPISVAWEVIPLSFVINWFISVGTFLSSLDAGVGLDIHNGYQTTFVKGSSFASGGNHPYGTSRAKWFLMERQVLETIAPPGITVRWGLNLNKLVTVMALAKQRGLL